MRRETLSYLERALLQPLEESVLKKRWRVETKMQSQMDQTSRLIRWKTIATNTNQWHWDCQKSSRANWLVSLAQAVD